MKNVDVFIHTLLECHVPVSHTFYDYVPTQLKVFFFSFHYFLSFNKTISCKSDTSSLLQRNKSEQEGNACHQYCSSLSLTHANNGLYAEKYLPRFYFCPFCLCCQQSVLSLGAFQCLKLSLIHKCVWVNIRRGETVCKYRRAKITQGQNNPVNIYTIGEISWNKPIRIWHKLFIRPKIFPKLSNSP